MPAMVKQRKALSTSGQGLGLLAPGYPAGLLAGPLPAALEPKVLLGVGVGLVAGYLLSKVL